jgi:hypothetical protein
MNMTTSKHVSRVLWCQAIGFAIIIALSWADEFADLPRYFFGGPQTPNWSECVLETVIVLMVAIPVMLLTHRVVARLHYLEGFLRVCAWCKKIQHDGQWVPVEEFLRLRLDSKSTHGICSACMAGEMTKSLGGVA